MASHNYLRQWLNIPVCGKVEIARLNKGSYGQEIVDISSKHKLCHLSFRQCLNISINDDIRKLHSCTSEKSNQYDSFQTTKAVLKRIREEQTAKIESFNVPGAVI